MQVGYALPEMAIDEWAGEWLEALPELVAMSGATQREWIVQRIHQARPVIFERLAQSITQLALSDVTLALNYATLLRSLADLSAAKDTTLNRIFALSAMANSYRAASAYQEALEYYNQAGELLEGNQDRLLFGKLQIGKINTLIFLSRYEEAQSLALELEEILLAEGQLIDAAKVMGNLGGLYQRRDRYEEATYYYTRAAKLAGSGQDKVLQAKIKLNLALIYAERRDFKAALLLDQECREVFEQAQLGVLLAMLDGNKGWIYFRQGNYMAALQAYERARANFQAKEMEADVRRCEQELADIHLELNLLDEALTTYKRILPYFDLNGPRFESAKTRTRMGVALARQGNIGQALKYLKEAAALFRTEGNRVWQGLVDLARGELFLQVANKKRAGFYFKRANQTFEALSLTRYTLEARYGLARLRLRSAPEKTSGLLNELLQAALTLEADELIPHICSSLAEITADTGKALDYYRLALAKMDQLRVGLPSEEFKTAFLRNKLSIYEGVQALCLRSGREAEAFQYLEQAKSRVLLERLGQSLAAGSEEVSPAAAELYRKLGLLRAELNRLYRQDSTLKPGTFSPAPDAATPETAPEQAMAGLEQQYTETMRQLGLLEAAAPAQARPEIKPANLAEVQAGLDDATTWLEFAQVEGRLLAFVITRHSFTTRWLAGTVQVKRLQELAAYQFGKFKYGDEYVTRHRASLLSSVQGHLAGLYDCLIGPLIELLDPQTRPKLIIVPHGTLHLLPFGALYNRTTGRYLLEDFSLSCTVSASIHLLGRSRPHDRPGQLRALAIGVPDDNTQQIEAELKLVAGLMEGSRALSGPAATLRNWQDHAANYNILHLATHGYFRYDNPLFSALKLADGLLTVNDIYNLRLQAWLVVLNACDSGQNVVTYGDELLGLARGFFYAGVPSVVVSLWTVHDRASAELTRYFYSNLLNRADKAEALRAAQLRLMKEEKFAHPYYWGGIVLIGER
jgi:CHAT domain-containing protein